MGQPERPIELQIQFARHNFENHQSLIRFSDTKAGAMVTLFLFLAASALQIIKDATIAMHVRPAWVLCISFIYAIACLGMLSAFLRCVWGVQTVLRPRGARHYKNPVSATELIWQDHVVAHRSNADYGEAVKMAEPELLLKNLTDQVFELAHISKEKMDALQHVSRAVWFGFWCWCAAITTGLILLRLK